MLTSRIKTVRAGERDCPQDNQLSKRARTFDLIKVEALFLYIVATRFIIHSYPWSKISNSKISSLLNPKTFNKIDITH